MSSRAPEPGFYHIKDPKWSNIPVQLPNESLPNVSDHLFVSEEDDGAALEYSPCFNPFLVKLSETILALIWDFLPDKVDACEVHWTKFRIVVKLIPPSPTFSGDCGSLFIDFRPELGALSLSTGISLLEPSTTMVQNCTAAVGHEGIGLPEREIHWSFKGGKDDA